MRGSSSLRGPILAALCSDAKNVSDAARRVPCTAKTIRRLAAKDPEVAAALRGLQARRDAAKGKRSRRRPVSVPDTTQTIIGAAVLHFASGDFGEQLFGVASLFAAEAVDRRRRELREFFHRALVRAPGGAAVPAHPS